MTDRQLLHLFDIQRFSLHDGPGIRTTVFFKGCNLRCPWCSNPESQRREKDLLYMENSCLGCGACAAQCPQGAIRFHPGELPVFHRDRCQRCGRCVQVCPGSALRLAGMDRTVEDVLNLVERDRAYYERSGGGLTLSGGEPLLQPEAAEALAFGAQNRGLSVALETAGDVDPEHFSRVVRWVDLLLLDVKHGDPQRLQAVTGAHLDRILSNLAQARSLAKEIVLRVPVIPGFNNEPEDLRGILRLAVQTGVSQVDLLPYHLLGKSKYTQLGRAYPYEDKYPALEKESLIPCQTWGDELHLQVTIGGKRLPLS